MEKNINNIISDDDIYELYINKYNNGNKEEKNNIIWSIINYNSARIYRLMLVNCVLTNEHTELLESKLRKLKEDPVGFAENFYYLLQTDSRSLKFENGIDDIENFINIAFRKNRIEVPIDVEELIKIRKEEKNENVTIGNTIAWLKQHVMVDDEPSTEKVPFINSGNTK